MNWKQLSEQVIQSLSTEERDTSIVYLEERVIPKDELLPWDGIQKHFDQDVVIAFVDLEPELNWTHQGRYVVLNPEGEIQQTIGVDKPPFLRGVSSHLRTILKGKNAPDWAMVAPLLD